MKTNVSELESHVRTICAGLIALITIFIVESSLGQILLMLIATILAITAFFRTCPIYHLNNTRSVKQDTAKSVSPDSEVPS